MASNYLFPRNADIDHGNALDIARVAFTRLVTGPHPVTVDGSLFEGLPNREILLNELRDCLLHRPCRQHTRDAVWAHLVARSRSEGSTWTVAAVGMALPALTSVAATLSARIAGDHGDIHAEVLSGFLAALPNIDISKPRIMVRLRWEAYRSGYRALTNALAAPTPTLNDSCSRPLSQSSGHPDLVLAHAVADKVLTIREADLIGATRLDDSSVGDWAQRHGISQWSAYKIRSSAEARLVTYLYAETDATPQLSKTAKRHSGRSSKKAEKSGVPCCEQSMSGSDTAEAPRCA